MKSEVLFKLNFMARNMIFPANQTNSTQYKAILPTKVEEKSRTTQKVKEEHFSISAAKYFINFFFVKSILKHY